MTYMLAFDALALGLLRVTELRALRLDRTDGAGFIQKAHHSLAAEMVSAQKSARNVQSEWCRETWRVALHRFGDLPQDARLIPTTRLWRGALVGAVPLMGFAVHCES